MFERFFKGVGKRKDLYKSPSGYSKPLNLEHELLYDLCKFIRNYGKEYEWGIELRIENYNFSAAIKKSNEQSSLPCLIITRLKVKPQREKFFDFYLLNNIKVIWHKSWLTEEVKEIINDYIESFTERIYYKEIRVIDNDGSIKKIQISSAEFIDREHLKN